MKPIKMKWCFLMVVGIIFLWFFSAMSQRKSEKFAVTEWVGGSWRTKPSFCDQVHGQNTMRNTFVGSCDGVQTKILAKDCQHYNSKWKKVKNNEDYQYINVTRAKDGNGNYTKKLVCDQGNIKE